MSPPPHVCLPLSENWVFASAPAGTPRLPARSHSLTESDRKGQEADILDNLGKLKSDPSSTGDLGGVSQAWNFPRGCNSGIPGTGQITDVGEAGQA